MTTPETLEGAPGALLVIISGPSGVGKDTIIDALAARPREPDYHYVVTCTTRGPRPGEVAGVSYQFLSHGRSTRSARRASCSRRTRSTATGTGRRGARSRRRSRPVTTSSSRSTCRAPLSVKEHVPDALLVFIVPPSLEALFQRLRSRATETADELEIRQRNAAIELARQDDYDHVVVNETGEVERTAAEIEAIIEQEKRRNGDRRIRIA